MLPSFLQKIDDKLLRNKPGVWAARTHMVLYFTMAFALILSALCYFVFFDAKQYSHVGAWNTFVVMITIVGFVFWMIFLMRFNVFKRFGNWSAADGLRDFVLYFSSIGLMVAVCFVPSAIETLRANQQFGNEEVVNDVNELNINACKLDYNILPLVWEPDTCRVVDTLPVVVYSDSGVQYESVDGEVTTDVAMPMPVNKINTIDTAGLRNKLNNADSVLKLNDSTYVFYECPKYMFVGSYFSDRYSKEKVMSSADIYNSVLKNYQKPDRAALLKRMLELRNKYGVDDRNYYGNYYDNNQDTNYEARIKRKYDFGRISNGVNNIVQKKYEWTENWPIYLRIFYYATLLITLLVFIFRHTTAKTFFLSVLTAVLLTILTGLIMVLSYGQKDISLLSFIIVYYAVFLILAVSVFKTNVRTAVQGIGLNLFLFMTPFIPLVIVSLYLEIQQRNLFNDPEMDRSYYDSNLYYLTAEIAGSVILFILLQPLFKKLYRKWFAAPEE